MNKLKQKDTGFTMVANKPLCDKGLSLSAKGLYAYLRSKPDNWQFSSERLECKECPDTVRVYLKELEDFGLLIRKRKPDGRMEYFIQHKPLLKKASQEIFLTGNLPDVSNTELNNNTDINNNIYGKPSLPHKEIKIIEKEQPENQKNPINMVLDEFFNINPTLNYGNNTQRKAAQDLINIFGLDQLIPMIRWYITQTSSPFCPVATTPLAFKNKISEIKIYADKLKTSKNQVSKIERTLSDGTIAIKKYGVWVMKSDPNVKIDLKYFPELQDFSPKNNNPKIIEVETS